MFLDDKSLIKCRYVDKVMNISKDIYNLSTILLLITSYQHIPYIVLFCLLLIFFPSILCQEKVINENRLT